MMIIEKEIKEACGSAGRTRDDIIEHLSEREALKDLDFTRVLNFETGENSLPSVCRSGFWTRVKYDPPFLGFSFKHKRLQTRKQQ